MPPPLPHAAPEAPAAGRRTPPIPQEAPRAPTAEEWAALDEAGRQRAVLALVSSVTQEEIDEREAMSEGDPHLDAKMDVRDTLRPYFRRLERRVYVGAEIKVYYPGEKGFTPDVIAVRDAEQRPRICWMVSQEGQGVDLALEVHYEGDWRKDFVTNVERYATLGIPEYFIYDIRREHVKGYRLPEGKRRYQALRPRAGRLRSQGLDLELTVEDGKLRFYAGTAQLIADRDLVPRLEQMVDAAQGRAEAEQARADEAMAQAEGAMRRLSSAIVTILRLRGLPIDDEVTARIESCGDLAVLDRWLGRAATVVAAAELFVDD